MPKPSQPVFSTSVDELKARIEERAQIIIKNTLPEKATQLDKLFKA